MRDVGIVLNDKDFSDRILNLELVRNSSDSVSDSDDFQNSNKKQKGIGASTKTDPACEESSESSTSVEVKTLHIASAVLALRSPFFYKLFKNGMKESHERSITLTINRSEEGAFMDLLNYMYTNTLTACSAPDLLAVLMLADKFEVTSCMNHCSKLLQEMGMSIEYAILYVEIPSTVVVGEVVQSLIDDAKDYLLDNYSDMTSVEDQKEALGFPLSAIEVILGGRLTVRSEDDVYEFILSWGRAQYPKLRERRPVITELMARFLHFPYLRISTLREIQESPKLDRKKISNLILESLYINAGYPYGEQFDLFPRPIKEPHVRRVYDEFHIKETQFGSCHVVYLNLWKFCYEECSDQFDQLFTREGRYSQMFFLGGQSFKFWINIDRDIDKLSLFLERMKGKNGTCTFDYELQVQTFMRWSWSLERIHKFENCSLNVGERVGSTKLFGISWHDLMKKQNYFVNGILHLRAQFTIKNSHPLG